MAELLPLESPDVLNVMRSSGWSCPTTKTLTAKMVGKAAQELPPSNWWDEFAANFHAPGA